MDDYTYIVVGAGAAGCVLANRLSQDPANKVLLLEAGGPDRNRWIHIPRGTAKLKSSEFLWGFATGPQSQMNDREISYPQGRTLGGSTSVNAMIYVRGNRADYDRWKSLGNDGWGYDDVLPWFRKSENNTRLKNGFHGAGGELNVTQPKAQINPLTKAFARAAQELGLKYNPDVNGGIQDGVTFYDFTQRDGRRESSATAFLRPVLSRPNLTVETNARATKIIIDRGSAVDDDFCRDGQTHTVYADGEVVLSSGTINSPRLLLLSGIGPADHLRSVGVDVVHDLPGVGQNLQDHMDVFLTAETAPVSYTGFDRLDRRLLQLFQYRFFKSGPMTAGPVEAGAFIRSSDAVLTPDIQVHCLPSYLNGYGLPLSGRHGITINTCHLRPRSTGSVTLRSPDPELPPFIDPNYCGDRDGYDWEIAVEGFRWGRRLLRTEAFAPLIGSETMPGGHVESDADVRAYIRRWSKTDYHPVGTCSMGSDVMAVVDTQLRVRGLERLRVIDASVMPRLISGNTQAPSYMVGERGAAMVLAGELV